MKPIHLLAHIKKYILEIIVFFSGAVVMILELTGSRILAPYVGASLYVWTSLIGIILAALSLGYYLGGRFADTNASLKTFSHILFFGACALGFTAFCNQSILETLSSSFSDLRVASFFASLIIFGLPSVILGMVSPYAIRLKLKDVESSGKTIGNLYALSTIGSILGTFFTGFYLMSFLGSQFTLSLLAVIFFLLSLLASSQSWKRNILFLLFIILQTTLMHSEKVLAEKEGFIDFDTAYNRVIIKNTTDPQTQKPIRIYMNEAEGVQSGRFTDGTQDLVFAYSKFYRLIEHFRPETNQVLAIGGGALSVPRDFLFRSPSSTIDVVELDRELTQMSRDYFGFVDDPRLQMYYEDGRIFLNKNTKKYDAIFLDAFYGLTPPFQLTSREAVQKMYDALEPGGVLLVNSVAGFEGDASKLFHAFHRTYSEFFPQVYVFQVNKDTEIPTKRQTVFFVAVKSTTPISWQSQNPELQQYLNTRWTKVIPQDVPVLTDDFAPVEWYSVQSM